LELAPRLPTELLKADRERPTIIGSFAEHLPNKPLAHSEVPDTHHPARLVDQVACILGHWHDHRYLEMPELGLLLTVRHFAEPATRF